MTADPQDVLTRSARPSDAIAAYGSHQDQIVELWWPEPAISEVPAALVLIIHGGFWLAEWDRSHARPMAAALADAGHVVGLVEYRRIGSPDGGGWPGTFDDISTAVDQLPEMITAIVPDHLCSDDLVLVGHSAGGHLALWAAARHRLPADLAWHSADRSRVQGVVALAPVSALARADREQVGEGAVAALMGGHADDLPDRYRIADPTALAPSGVRTVVIHGTQDPEVPVEQSRAYVEHAVAGGDDVTYVELDGTGHYAVIDPRSHAWPAVREGVRELAQPRSEPR